MKRKKILFPTMSALIGFLIIALLIEWYLRSTGQYETWPEKSTGTYVSEYTPKNGGDPNYRYAPNTTATIPYPMDGFTDIRKVNGLGFCDIKVPKIPKPHNELWIAFLGDSYTRGFGASGPEHSLPLLYGKKVETSLRVNGFPDIVVRSFNFGVDGSDPFYAYYLYTNEVLRPYQFDIVILAMNSTDFMDVALRGGMNRFKEKKVKYRHPDRHKEWWYQRSHIVRALVNHTERPYPYFRTQEELDALGDTAVNEIANLLIHFRDRAAQRGTAFFLLPLPHATDQAYGPGQAWPGYHWESLWTRINNHIRLLDNGNCFVDAVRSDPGKNWRYFFWKYCEHPTDAGYQKMVECIPAIEVKER